MISITVNHYHHFPHSDMSDISTRIDKIMATQAELAAQLANTATQLEKAKAELLGKIQALTDAVAAADNVSPEVQAAADALAAVGQQLDDIVPDAPTEPTEPVEPV